MLVSAQDDCLMPAKLSTIDGQLGDLGGTLLEPDRPLLFNGGLRGVREGVAGFLGWSSIGVGSGLDTADISAMLPSPTVPNAAHSVSGD